MDGPELFSRCLAQATDVVRQVRPEHLANATPCTDWHVRDLIDYMLSELTKVPTLLAGAVVELADLHGDETETNVDEADVDISVEWQIAADAAEVAAAATDPDELAHPVDGVVSNDLYLRRVATDLLVQAWGLATAIGMSLGFDPGAAQVAYDYAVALPSVPQPEACAVEPLPIASTASAQAKLLALYGRSPTWRSTS